MNRGTFERRFSRLVEALGELSFSRLALLMRFATEEEARRLHELLGKQAKTERTSIAKLAPGEIAEFSALFATWDKRLRTRLHQQ